jgi:hypothetical protein
MPSPFSPAQMLVTSELPPPATVAPGAGRVLRIARVEYAAGMTRVILSDGSELGGLTQCCVSRFGPDQSAAVSLRALIAAREPKETP